MRENRFSLVKMPSKGTQGGGEIARWVKMPNSRTTGTKADAVVCVCSLSTPMGRRDVGTGVLPRTSQATWSMSTEAETGDTLPQKQGGKQILKSCPLTSYPTALPQYSF